MSDIDDMLQGNETPSPTSQVQNGSQIDAPDNGQLSEEEVEFNKLSGSTQDRIKQLVRGKREAMERASSLESMMRSVPPPAPSENGLNPDIQQTVRKLGDVGIATDEKVDAKLSQVVNSIRYEQEMSRLAEKYNGNQGEPKFDRTEYEDYLKDNPIYYGYTPEDTFRDHMFRDQFVGPKQDAKATSPKTLRPTRTSQIQETMTPEYIEEKLKSLPPEQRNRWLKENEAEVNAIVSKMNPNA